VLALFYRMTRLDAPLAEIVRELNEQLKESMPVGRFVAATLSASMKLHERAKSGSAGRRKVCLFDRWGRIVRHFPSQHLPLGILSSDEINCQPVELTWEAESQLLLCSDGLLEATDASGRQFGLDGIAQAAANTSPEKRFQQIENTLAQHLNGSLASDDISLMVIDCP
jgi:two-component system, HptB-dependent secretion and biofilm response regulator